MPPTCTGVCTGVCTGKCTGMCMPCGQTQKGASPDKAFHDSSRATQKASSRDSRRRRSDMCIDMCAHMCADMCADMCAHMCAHISTDTCADMCIALLKLLFASPRAAIWACVGAILAGAGTCDCGHGRAPRWQIPYLGYVCGVWGDFGVLCLRLPTIAAFEAPATRYTARFVVYTCGGKIDLLLAVCSFLAQTSCKL